jgi:hypothetical protein
MSRLLFFLIAFWLATGIGANAQPSCALPHRSRLNAVSPSPPEDWNDAEKWAWTKIAEGEIADFNLLYCHRLEPGQPEGWDDPKNIRRLSAKFLRDIARKPFRNSIPDEGILIVGAWFPGGIDLRFANLEGPMLLGWSRVDGDVGLLGASVDQLVMSGSSFKGVNMDGIEVKSDLFMRNGATFDGDVNLGGASVGGQLEMTGSSFKGVNMEKLQVKSDLFMRNGATFDGDVNLDGASVGGQLVMSGSIFKGDVSMMSLKVGQYLLLFSDTFDGDVNLSLASVGGMLGVGGSTFKGVKMGGLQVPHLAMTDGATFDGDVNLSLASVGGALNFGGATFHRNVDLAGATVTDLLLGSTKDPSPKWDPGSRLILRDANVGGLKDRIDQQNGQDHDAWPDSLELDGFVYGRLASVSIGDEQAEMTNHDIGWYVRWIKRNLSFSPQPYRQLAKVFRELGFPEKAEDILYAARAEERSQAWVRREYIRWLGLSLLQFIVGYGIGSYAFRVLFWVLGFSLLGTAVLWFSVSARAKGPLWRFAASFDRLLPIVQLNKEFDDFFNDPDRKRLKGWQMAYFAVQALTGYVLASFLVAAMAGLTQTS